MDKRLVSKESIKKEFLKKRSKLSIEEIIEKSNKIKERLFSSQDYKDSKAICFYVSFGSEVYTHTMIKESIKNGKTVCVPVINDDYLLLSKIDSFNALNKKNTYGILEPSEIKEIKKDDIGLIIVPAVAFDKSGYRIGYGKGYYDKLLADFKGKKIGLAFELQIVDKIPVKKYDIKMDNIITEV